MPSPYVTVAVCIAIIVLCVVVYSIPKQEGLGAYVPKPDVSYYVTRMGGRQDVTYVALHYTHWCPACRAFTPVWDATAANLSGMNIIMDKIDEDVAHTPWIQGYPTVILVRHGVTYEFQGPRTVEGLSAFILDATKK